mmetsp:Transcript_4913/g.14238  ORF Transcript_4913/g.14238 Transcript_4913/m.14238 type:complete len:213 (-) Transcript_4913:1741-2379(-)
MLSLRCLVSSPSTTTSPEFFRFLATVVHSEGDIAYVMPSRTWHSVWNCQWKQLINILVMMCDTKMSPLFLLEQQTVDGAGSSSRDLVVMVLMVVSVKDSASLSSISTESMLELCDPCSVSESLISSTSAMLPKAAVLSCERTNGRLSSTACAVVCERFVAVAGLLLLVMAADAAAGRGKASLTCMKMVIMWYMTWNSLTKRYSKNCMRNGLG